MGLSRPNVFAAATYREFLRDFFHFEKQNSTQFSYRVFSAKAGFKSPNFLKLVIEGQRNLTIESARKVGMAFKLSNEETTFLVQLVQRDQAKTSGERAKAIKEMCKSKVYRDLYPLKPLQFDFYQNWYCIPIREMVADASFREDPRWICAKLRNLITPAQAKQALEDMLKLGLLRRAANGRLELAQLNITTGDDVQSAAVACFHKQMLSMASDAIDKVERYKREVSGSTILISEATFHRLKDQIQAFRKTLLAEAELDTSDDKAVYQIGFQLFPLSDSLKSQVDESEEDACKNAS